MNREEFEMIVSAITDKAWSKANRLAMSGITTPVETGLDGVFCTGGDTRDRLRYKIHKAARSVSFDKLRSLA